MECTIIEPLTIDWIRDKKNIKTSQCCTVTSLTLMGTISEKIGSLGSALSSFHSLVILDISRNAVRTLDGLHYCKELKDLNLYYNNVSEQSELLKLSENPKLEKLELRLNPISKYSPEYRLLLVHALPYLKVLDSVMITDRDRKMSLEHYNTDQAALFTSYNQENIPEEVIIRKKEMLEESEVLSAQFYASLRPPQNILTPTKQAYNSLSARGQYTPNPSLSSASSGEMSPSTRSSDNSRTHNNKKSKKSENYLASENTALRDQVTSITNDYNEAISNRISKESYVRLQEQHHVILKEVEELRQLYATSSEQVEALKQHISNIELQNDGLKEELKVKDELYVVDTELKEKCSELQDTIAKERSLHKDDLQKHVQHTTGLHKEYNSKIKALKLKNSEAMESLQSSLTEVHAKEIQHMHWNFETLKETVGIADLILNNRNV